MRGRYDQHGVAIWLGRCHELGADNATGARLVFDHHCLMKVGLKFLAQQAGYRIGYAASARLND
jgi:hypothetical protein